MIPNANTAFPRGSLSAKALFVSVLFILFTICTSMTQTTCRNYQQLQNSLDSARAKWTNPACYNMKVERLGNFVFPQGPYDIKVRHNQVVDNGGGNLEERTINDYFDWIESECLEGCPGRTTAAHWCWGSFDETSGAPKSLSIDRLEYLADADEEAYRITDFQVVECDQCVEYKQVAADLQRARNTWAASRSSSSGDCYEMNVQRMRGGRQDGPFTVEIQHGKVTHDGGGGTMAQLSVHDYFRMIQERCVNPCPSGEDAWYKCQVTYNDNGAPSKMHFHLDRRVADVGEELYTITDFKPIQCDKCVDYRKIAAELRKARAKWSSPPCYDFTVQELGDYFPDARRGRPFNVQVRNGAMMDSGGGHLKRTVNDWFDFIQETCLADCPHGEDAPHKCVVTYHDNGAPRYMHIDLDAAITDTLESSFRITNVRPVNCEPSLWRPKSPSAGGSDSSAGIVSVRQANCMGELPGAFDTALQAWEEQGPPQCYTYTIERVGRIQEEYRGPFTVVVENQVATVTEGSQNVQMDRTIDEWLSEFSEVCLDGCPNNETEAEECIGEFDTEIGYPLRMKFDYSLGVADEEKEFMVTSFAVTSCPGDTVTEVHTNNNGDAQKNSDETPSVNGQMPPDDGDLPGDSDQTDTSRSPGAIFTKPFYTLVVTLVVLYPLFSV